MELTQLKSVFAKTGARSQSELLTLLATGVLANCAMDLLTVQAFKNFNLPHLGDVEVKHDSYNIRASIRMRSKKLPMYI